MLSGNLADGSRIQLVIPPASLYETLSIRKFTLKQVSFEEYEAMGFFSSARGVGIKEYSESYSQTDELLDLYDAKNWQGFIRQAILQKKTSSYRVELPRVRQPFSTVV